MKTVAYIDGFNLYYGCLKGTEHRWLDPVALFRALLPDVQVHRIRYFTARVSGKGDQSRPLRQQAYLRALQTIPNLSVHFGQFLSHPINMPLAKPLPEGPTHARVIKTEEKGSDVNIATCMLADAFRKECTHAVLVSNDSDLAEPVRVLHQELDCVVTVLAPVARPRREPSRELIRVASFLKPIRAGVLASSQFALELRDRKGTIRKPDKW